MSFNQLNKSAPRRPSSLREKYTILGVWPEDVEATMNSPKLFNLTTNMPLSAPPSPEPQPRPQQLEPEDEEDNDPKAYDPEYVTYVVATMLTEHDLAKKEQQRRESARPESDVSRRYPLSLVSACRAIHPYLPVLPLGLDPVRSYQIRDMKAEHLPEKNLRVCLLENVFDKEVKRFANGLGKNEYVKGKWDHWLRNEAKKDWEERNIRAKTSYVWGQEEMRQFFEARVATKRKRDVDDDSDEIREAKRKRCDGERKILRPRFSSRRG